MWIRISEKVIQSSLGFNLHAREQSWIPRRQESIWHFLERPATATAFSSAALCIDARRRQVRNIRCGASFGLAFESGLLRFWLGWLHILGRTFSFPAASIVSSKFLDGETSQIYLDGLASVGFLSKTATKKPPESCRCGYIRMLDEQMSKKHPEE